MQVWLRRLWIQLTSDRRKFAALCVTIGLAMLLWARLIVVSRMPRTAIAEDAVAAASQASVATGNTQRDLSESAASAGPITIRLASSINRDPFAINPRFFPKPTLIPDLAQDAGKSQVKPAEEVSQTQSRLDALLRQAVEQLRLEAAVAGSIAVINGRTCRTGDWIEVSPTSAQGESIRLQVTQIKQRSVVVHVMDQQFEIQMPTKWNP